MKRPLIAYFSASGETARLARTLADAAGGELYEIRPAQPYTDADLNWNDPDSRSSVEMKDAASRPAIEGPSPDLSPYDVVFLGFPIWWYEAPRIIHTFLEGCDFSGKTVIPFATSGGSGLGKTGELLQKACPAARFLPGRRMRSGASLQEASAWMQSLDL